MSKTSSRQQGGSMATAQQGTVAVVAASSPAQSSQQQPQQQAASSSQPAPVVTPQQQPSSTSATAAAPTPAAEGAATPPVPPPPPPAANAAQPLQPRFEDLTIDDDLPLLPRLQRYVQSSIALQRLVHVRMLGEVALEIGQQLTATELVPLLPPLVKDGESIIRQRLCAELKILCLVLMGMTGGGMGSNTADGSSNNNKSSQQQQSRRITSLPQIPKPTKSSKYYKVMVHHIFPHLFTLISDPDNEVRRAASENIVKLALRVDKEDVVTLALSIPLRLVKEGQKRASAAAAGQKNGTTNKDKEDIAATTNPQTPAEDLLITASNLLADLASFLPPTRLPPETTTRYLSPTILALAEDPNFRVRRAAVQALPRMLGSATLDDVKLRLLPKFVALSGDEMYRVRKASGECLVDVSRALGVLPFRVHFDDVWIDHDKKNVKDKKGESGADDNEHATAAAQHDDITEAIDVPNRQFYKPRSKEQIADLNNTIHECHDIRRRALCAIAKKLLEDGNKFVRYGMMQFLGPLIASFYPLDRGSMVGGMGGLLYCGILDDNAKKASLNMGTLGIGVESVGLAKGSMGLERVVIPERGSSMYIEYRGEFLNVEDILSYNHSLHGLELILHGESPVNHAVLSLGGGCNANKDPFGTMGPQFFPHANGMVGRSSALDDDDTDSFLLKANLKKINRNDGGVTGYNDALTPRALLPKFILESRSDALALARIVLHRTGRIPTDAAATAGDSTKDTITLPHPPLMSGRPDPDDLKYISSSLLLPFIAMASCKTGEETTDAEMRVYCAYSLPAVILLFGGANWERDGLKKCFLDLLIGYNNKRGSDMMEDGDAGGVDAAAANNSSGPPLPVKRCLASSVHAVAHMLGPDIVSNDPAFLAVFEKAFLRDPDEAIRLNVLKNLASFLGALPPGDGTGCRNTYLPVVQSIIMGEDVLGATKRRSASNPGVLNWRQRDAVSKVLPDLIVLFDADLNHEYLWPILKALLTDSVSAVRENAGWTVPVLLRKYVEGQLQAGGNKDEMMPTAWTLEVTGWLRDTFLDESSSSCNGAATIASPRMSPAFRRHHKKQMASSEGAFSKRQGYCRILAAVALAMRMGEGEGITGQGIDNTSMTSVPIDPFGKMSPYERDQFRTILLRDLLPPALEMAVDCVANVRLTLTKCLKVLPQDIRKASHVEEVLSTLEEELMTWDVMHDAVNPAATSSLSDPPEKANLGGGNTVIMTSTMSAC